MRRSTDIYWKDKGKWLSQSSIQSRIGFYGVAYHDQPRKYTISQKHYALTLKLYLEH